MDVNAAIANQLKNIETRSGKSLAELHEIIRKSGLTKHGQIRDMLKTELSMGHGDANTLAHNFLDAGKEAPANDDEVLSTIYGGPKAALQPIHEAIMAKISALGEFEISPKKTYLSLRRKKQFAMVGPATNSRIEVGLNMKGVDGTDRLEAQPAGGMCQYKVKITEIGQVDDELVNWIKIAYDSAG